MEPMRVKFITLFILCFSLIGCGNNPHQKDVFTHLFDKFNQEMMGDLELHAMQHRITTDPKIRKIAVDFYHYQEVEILHARFLIHQVTERLLERLNTCAYIRSHFDHFPLTEKDLEVSISFIDPKTHKRHALNELSNVSLLNGRIYFSAHRKDQEIPESMHTEEYISQKR